MSWAGPRRLSGALRQRAIVLGLAALLLVTGTAIITAALRTSATFDEIVMIAGGARGFATGEWDLVPEHPPLTQYLYGAIVHLARPALPDESAVTVGMRQTMGYRYRYAQQLFWAEGNDPERLALLGRIPAVLLAVGLVLLVFCYGRSIGGSAVGLVAATLTASLPDLLAHGGVAYNDIPLALAFVAALWAGHSAIRDPTVRRGLMAGGLIAVALGVKNSAVALLPIAFVLLVWEAFLRRGDRAWLRALPLTVCASLAAAYGGLVLVYRGDYTLEEYRYAVDFAFSHVTQLPTPSFLLGEVRLGGRWYFFPVAFLFKTSAALHLLILLAGGYFVSRLWYGLRSVPNTRLRGPLVGLAVFTALLLTASLNIGFRHALPALPLLCIGTAAGAVALWRISGVAVRRVIAIAVLWPALHVSTYYPFFLSYVSEYGLGEEHAPGILADSSLDWGQGLLELRRFMHEHEIAAVMLSYFGSALPEGYGIRYAPLPSFFPLPPQPPLEAQPTWAAISATNLSGTYFQSDPFALFRDARPDHVVAKSIFLYRLDEGVP
jgi:hypothetical protein